MRRLIMMALLFMASIPVFVTFGAAMAQTAEVGPVDQLMAELLPLVAQALDLIMAAAIAGAAGFAMRKWGIDIGTSRKDMLHSALMSGARAALARGYGGIKAAEFAEAYARASSPGAFAALRPAPEVVQNLARAKLEEARMDPLAQALTSAVGK